MAKETDEQRHCHECGEILVRDVRPFEIHYKGESITVDQPGWYCNGCGEGVLSGADMGKTDRDFLGLKARVDGTLSPDEVRRVRKKLGLTQKQAGLLLGGGPRAFQKYESGEVGASRAMSNLLKLLDAQPGLLQTLEVDSQAA